MRKEDRVMRDINMTMDNGKPEILMTGQEWYDRFEKELEIGLDLPEVMRIWVKACARNAAGIE